MGRGSPSPAEAGSVQIHSNPTTCGSASTKSDLKSPFSGNSRPWVHGNSIPPTGIPGHELQLMTLIQHREKQTWDCNIQDIISNLIFGLFPPLSHCNCTFRSTEPLSCLLILRLQKLLCEFLLQLALVLKNKILFSCQHSSDHCCPLYFYSPESLEKRTLLPPPLQSPLGKFLKQKTSSDSKGKALVAEVPLPFTFP